MRSAATKSFLAKTGQVGGKWRVVDAEGKVLGRLAAQLATVLMGKHTPQYTPHVLTGDFVVVVNAEKVKLTGRKMEQLEYDRYTYHPGGRRVDSIAKVMTNHPERIIKLAVRRMLPKSKLGDHMFKRLKVYKGPTHPHAVQKPEKFEPKLK